MDCIERGEARTRPALIQGPEWDANRMPEGLNDKLGVRDSHEGTDSWPTSFSSTTIQP
jgi:hypothetical protein